MRRSYYAYGSIMLLLYAFTRPVRDAKWFFFSSLFLPLWEHSVFYAVLRPTHAYTLCLFKRPYYYTQRDKHIRIDCPQTTEDTDVMRVRRCFFFSNLTKYAAGGKTAEVWWDDANLLQYFFSYSYIYYINYIICAWNWLNVWFTKTDFFMSVRTSFVMQY